MTQLKIGQPNCILSRCKQNECCVLCDNRKCQDRCKDDNLTCKWATDEIRSQKNIKTIFKSTGK